MKLLIISGRSGSGKSTALHILEDQDYYCIDNLPASLLQSLVARIFNDETLISKVTVSIDARNISLDLQQVPSIVGKLRAQNIHTEIIFLNANSQTLLNRFSESRRKHPLSNAQTSLDEAISKESELLEPIALMANLSIDTSAMSLNTLQDTVKSNVIEATLGCTGGQHRSVYLCERLGRFFERIIEKVQVRHRELTI